MSLSLVSLPNVVLGLINGYLIKPPRDYHFGKNRETKQCLWEYFITLNKPAHRLSLSYCYQHCFQVFKSTLSPLNRQHYRDSLKINRQLLFRQTDQVKFLVYYDLITDSYWQKKGRIWEIYDGEISYGISSGNRFNFILKLLGLLTDNLIGDYKLDDQKGDDQKGEISYSIIKIRTKSWNYFSHILKKQFGLEIPLPKIGENIVCRYPLKYPEVLVSLTTGSYIPYYLNGVWISLTQTQIAYLKRVNLTNILIENLDKHIDTCYHYDDCYGKLILDSIDPEIEEYREALDHLYQAMELVGE